MTRLLINEIFGPTWQGEGVSVGTHCLFVRLALCNLECTWCDTAQTWAFTPDKAAKHLDLQIYDKADEIHEMTSAEIVDRLEELWPLRTTPTTIVISGGEPLMQQDGLTQLLAMLRDMHCAIQIETAGTIIPRLELDALVARYNVSPKLANSKNALKKRRKEGPLRFFANSDYAFFKFVVSDIPDLLEIDEIVIDFRIPRQRVYIMPEGIDSGAILDTAYAISQDVLKRGYNMTLRDHILIFGNKRGV